MRNSINSVTRLSLTQLLLSLLLNLLSTATWHSASFSSAAADAVEQELHRGFEATPDPSVQTFQPLLADPDGNFSLGFLRLNRTQLALAVLHLPSSEPLWQAPPDPTRPVRWSDPTRLTFNGSLVISDPDSGAFWSTRTDGDRVTLLNTSNLLVDKKSGDGPTSVVWQSFDFPTNTLVQGQNFTVAMSLQPSDGGPYALRVGDTFLGLYARFGPSALQIYWRHRALQAKAEITQGRGPIYARVDPDGFLGMYQTGDDRTPVDVESFATFQRAVPGAFLLLRLDPDGNLRAYYWAGGSGSGWVLIYEAIREKCELPSPCGPYGLCQPGAGCSCLDNRTAHGSVAGGCASPERGDICSDLGGGTGLRVLRETRVELPYKDLMGFERVGSLEECVGACERNCSCWGATYNNGSGTCYLVDYPIQTVVRVGDEGKIGYFKIHVGSGSGRNANRVRNGVEVALFCIAVALFVAAIGFGGYRIWRRKRSNGSGSRGRRRGHAAEDAGLSPGPYKSLGPSGSFGSIELGQR